MSLSYSRNSVTINLGKKGLDRYTKTSYPQRYGRYSEIEAEEVIYQFNLNGEICFAKSKHVDWPDRQEWVKRSIGNDWIYYSTGGYTGVFEAIGEFYLPNLQYPTNSLIGGRPFELPAVQRIINGWYDDVVKIAGSVNDASPEILAFLDSVLKQTPQKLKEKAEHLFTISEGRVSVLPPDSRHVDYNIIPLNIASGCLYKCRFCRVKSAKVFREKQYLEIDTQLDRLSRLYNEDLCNYNSVFLGEHDALCASKKLILYSVEQSFAKLGFPTSAMRGANFFLFGSVDSFLNCEDSLFNELQRCPGEFYINVGLESADQETLDFLGKPVTSGKVKEAFAKMQHINDSYLNVEVTANFLIDETLPNNHYPSFLRLVRDSLNRKKPKGCIYLSPLKFDTPSRELVFDFRRVKLQSRLPTFLYIIQRL